MTFRRIPGFIAIAAVAFLVSPQAAASSDEFSSRQWGLRRVGAESAWSAGRGKGAVVAIVDTGVDRRHEDLRDNLVAGYDFVDRDADPTDEHGHGTHVAGIAAARAENRVGIAGVAPEAKIMPIRVLDEDGRGFGSDIDDGVRWAVDHGADVVNLSLGDDVVIENLTGGTLTDTVNYAWSKGAVPVVAAGNDQLFRTELRNAKTLLVTATAPDDTKAYYATEVGFARWGMAAPGGTNDGGKQNMVFSTLWAKKKEVHYGWAMGTSMAAPHVAGAAAILLGAGLSPQQTVDKLLASAKDIGASGDDFTFGHGRLDVRAAVAGLPTKTSRSAPRPAPPDEGSNDEADAAPVLRPARTAFASPRAAEDTTPSPRQRGATDRPTASDARAADAAEQGESSSVLPPIVVGAALLAVAGGLVAFTLMRRLRARRG